MHPADRLTSYLDGELDAAAAAAVQRDLARDPALRELLAHLQTADAALTGITPAQPSDGFEARLAARLDAVLDQEITGPVEAVDDALSRRRRPRGGLLAAAAAGLIGLAVVGSAISGQLHAGGDDEGAAMLADGAQPEADRAEDPGPAGEAGESAVEEAANDAPLVVDEARRLDEALLADIATSGPLGRVGGQALPAAEGRELAAAFQAALGLGAPVGMTQDDGGQDELAGRDGGALSDEQRDLLRRCLTQILDSDPDAIPVHVEFGHRDDGAALAVGLVTLDPGTGAYTRVETWLMDADTCQVVQFTQH